MVIKKIYLTISVKVKYIPEIDYKNYFNFIYVLFYILGATCDKSSWFVVDECIKFYEDTLGGLARIQQHTSTVLKQAVEMLVNSWNTSYLELAADLEAPYMKMIKLPALRSYRIDNQNKADELVPRLMEDLLVSYKVVACIVYVQEELYCRISCFVYNQSEDYVKLRDAILDLI